MPKEILIITPGFLPLLGGMEQQVALLSSQFIKMGNSVTVLTEQTSESYPEKEVIDSINVVRIPTSPNRDFFNYFKLFNYLVKHILDNKNKYDFIIVRTLTFPAIVVGSLKYFKLISIPTLATAETGGSADDVIAVKRYPLHKLLVKLLGSNNHLNSLCEDNINHYKQLGFPSKKLVKVPNGIIVSHYSNFKYPSSISTFLYLGQLQKAKGIWELVKAFKTVREEQKASLIIAGSGPEEKELRDYIKTNHIPDIKMLGRIPQEELEGFFRKGECLVLPSYSEGLPLSVLEAASYKRILLTTDVSDLKLLFDNNIYFCKKQNEKDLAEKILLLLKQRDFSHLNYDAVIKKVDIVSVADQFYELLS